MNKFLCAVIIATSLFFCGCGNIKQGMGAAEAQVVIFHQNYNNQNIEAILAASDPQFFDSTPKADMMKLYGAVYKKLGKVTDSQMQNFNMRTFNLDTLVSINQDTKYERGKGVESFTFRIKGNKAYLLGYYVNSPDLILK